MRLRRASFFVIVPIVAAGCSRETAAPEPRPSLQLLDLAGAPVDPLTATDDKVKVFLFARVDCPISNRYAPEVRRLISKYAPDGVKFYLVYPDPDQTAEVIRNHVSDFEYPCEPLRDPKHQLVEWTGARKTPEAAVISAKQQLVYCGRIDDWYVDFGKARAAATNHDLQDAIEAALAGRSVENRRTESVGCYISDLRPAN